MRVKGVLPKGFELALAAAALLWTAAAAAISERSAHGLAVRFGLQAGEALIASLFLIFLLVVGFHLLDWIATRGSELTEVIALPRRTGWPTEWALGAAIGWAACLAVVLPLLLSGNLHGHLIFGARRPADLLLLTLTLLAATLAEELVFRGYVFLRLSAAIGTSWTAVLTSLAFGGFLVWAHPPVNLALGLLDGSLFGFLLALSYLRTHALWLAWGLHFSYRAVMLVLLGLASAGRASQSSVLDVFATGPTWLSGGRYGVDAALLTAPILLTASALLYRLTREYAWHYTFRPAAGAGYVVAVPPPTAHVEMEQAASAQLVQIMPDTSKSPTAPPPPRVQDVKSL